MRSLLLMAVLGCWKPAEAGDLWMTLEHHGQSDSVELHLPANWMSEAGEPIWLDTGAGRVDLRKEARALHRQRVGERRSWKLEKEGDSVFLELSHERLTGEPATQVGVRTRGPKGNGLTLTMDLKPEQLGQARQHLDGTIDIDGVEIDLERALCDQLKASPPTTIVVTTGPRGGGITIDTRR